MYVACYCMWVIWVVRWLCVPIASYGCIAHCCTHTHATGAMPAHAHACWAGSSLHSLRPLLSRRMFSSPWGAREHTHTHRNYTRSGRPLCLSLSRARALTISLSLSLPLSSPEYSSRPSPASPLSPSVSLCLPLSPSGAASLSFPPSLLSLPPLTFGSPRGGALRSDS